jgi:hypothetical protein
MTITNGCNEWLGLWLAGWLAGWQAGRQATTIDKTRHWQRRDAVFWNHLSAALPSSFAAHCFISLASSHCLMLTADIHGSGARDQLAHAAAVAVAALPCRMQRFLGFFACISA